MKILKLIPTFLILMSSFAVAGGSSTVGVGAPQWVFECYDQSHEIRVIVLRTYPNYDHDILAVNNNIDKPVTRVESAKPGAPLSFIGLKYVLSVHNTSPNFIDGLVYYPAVLSHLTDTSAAPIELMCKPEALK